METPRTGAEQIKACKAEEPLDRTGQRTQRTGQHGDLGTVGGDLKVFVLAVFRLEAVVDKGREGAGEQVLYSAFSAIAKQMANRFGANAISRLEVTASTPPDTRAFLRPRRSATMPLGTSHSRLTIWKTLSARPISHRENPVRPAARPTRRR